MRESVALLSSERKPRLTELRALDRWHEVDLADEGWTIWFRVGVGLAILVAVVSYDPLDPSVYNQLRPFEGVANWLSYPGALMAGFLFDHLGKTAWMLPFLLILTRHRPSSNQWVKPVLDIVVILAVNIIVALLLSGFDKPVIRFTGLVGYAAAAHLVSFPGFLISVLIGTGVLLRYLSFYRLNPLVITLSAAAFRRLIQGATGVAIAVGVMIGHFGRLVRLEFADKILPAVVRYRNQLAAEIEKTGSNLVGRVPKFELSAIFETIGRVRVRRSEAGPITVEETNQSMTTEGDRRQEILHQLLQQHEEILINRAEASPIMRSDDGG